MRYLSLLISLLFITCAASAQEVRLKSVTMTTDPMPRYMQRTDLNGEICGLVKVIIPGNQVRFEGSLIGEPEFKTSEYWCWLSPGTRFLKVKVPGFAPLMIDFKDFFDNGIKGMRIYEAVLAVPQPGASASGRVLKGTVNIEGLTHRVENEAAERKAKEEAIDGLVLYHNLHDGSYLKAVELTGDPFGVEGEKYNNTVEYLLDNVNYGDSLTFKFKNPHYADCTVRIPDENVEKSLFNLKLKRKRFNVTLRVVDGMTGDLVDSVTVSRWKDKIVLHGPHTEFIGLTDKNGIYVIHDAVDGKKLTLYLNKRGYQLPGGIGIIPVENCEKEIRMYGETDHFYIKGGNNVAVTLPDGSVTSPDSQGEVTIHYPVYPYSITISAPGYKTLKVRMDESPACKETLNMKKGNPADIVNYNMYKGKNKKRKD